MDDEEQHLEEQQQQQQLDKIEIEMNLVDEVLEQEQVEPDPFDDASSIFEGYL